MFANKNAPYRAVTWYDTRIMQNDTAKYYCPCYVFMCGSAKIKDDWHLKLMSWKYKILWSLIGLGRVSHIATAPRPCWPNVKNRPSCPAENNDYDLKLIFYDFLARCIRMHSKSDFWFALCESIIPFTFHQVHTYNAHGFVYTRDLLLDLWILRMPPPSLHHCHWDNK